MQQIPNRLWIPDVSTNDTLITLAFLLLRMAESGERVDLVTIADASITDSMLRKDIYPIFQSILKGIGTIFVTDRPAKVAFNPMAKVFLSKNNEIMRYLVIQFLYLTGLIMRT